MQDGAGPTRLAYRREVVFADYHQFYVEDPEHFDPPEDLWGDEAVERLLDAREYGLAVGTFSDFEVEVEVEVWDRLPDLPSDVALRNECELTVVGGSLRICGCTAYAPDAPLLGLAPGRYRVVILYFRADGDAMERYRLVLTPHR